MYTPALSLVLCFHRIDNAVYVCVAEWVCVNLQEHFWSLDESVEKLTPQLMVQIWDNDLGFLNDDFLGK